MVKRTPQKPKKAAASKQRKLPVRPRGGRMEWDVCELFAGVGGFRLGLEKSGWTIKFSSQWEPGAKKQHASDCYVRHFGQADKLNHAVHSNDDIAKVTAKLLKEPDAIPDHDLLVGGFPCQDYSVATTKAKGMEGKKGVLWWEIHKILKAKRPRYMVLENVDRLLASPSLQRGRDFAVILSCLRDLGYAVEWRVINAAEYGFSQKRRRTFIFAAHAETKIGQQMMGSFEPVKIIDEHGLFARAFPVEPTLGVAIGQTFDKSVQQVSDTFTTRFGNAGVMIPGRALWTLKTVPMPVKRARLRDVLIKGAPESLYVDQDMIWKVGDDRNNWEYVKGAKREDRMAKTGFKYFYTEGAIPFPDDLEQPSRTILTGDGNRRPNRTGHLIQDPWTKKYRVLSPVEAERLNGFPDDWTEGMPLSRRYFCMGNALVVNVVEQLGKVLRAMVESADKGKKLIKQGEGEEKVA